MLTIGRVVGLIPTYLLVAFSVISAAVGGAALEEWLDRTMLSNEAAALNSNLEFNETDNGYDTETYDSDLPVDSEYVADFQEEPNKEAEENQSCLTGEYDEGECAGTIEDNTAGQSPAGLSLEGHGLLYDSHIGRFIPGARFGGRMFYEFQPE